jgi:hypothetical protein
MELGDASALDSTAVVVVESNGVVVSVTVGPAVDVVFSIGSSGMPESGMPKSCCARM